MNIDKELENARNEACLESHSAANSTEHFAAYAACLASHSVAWSAARSSAWAAYNTSSYKEQLEQVRIIKELL